VSDPDAVSAPTDAGDDPVPAYRGVETDGPDDVNRLPGGRARAVLTYLARQIVDDPEGVTVEASEDGSGVRLELFVAPEDMGKVIGRKGRVAQAIRAIVRAAAAQEGVHVVVDIVD
jgi:hypothetical protein